MQGFGHRNRYSLLIIAKNVVLAGVKSVALYDPSIIELQDLSSQVLLCDTSFI